MSQMTTALCAVVPLLAKPSHHRWRSTTETRPVHNTSYIVSLMLRVGLAFILPVGRRYEHL
jgi:hypothetical protein